MRAVAAGLAVLLLAGCTPGSRPAPTLGATATTPAPTATSAAPSATTRPGDGAVTVVAVPDGFAGGFRTPSGNVRCEIDLYGVRCEARVQPWRELPERDCGGTADWRTRLVLEPEHGAALRGECGYEPPLGGPPLAYGTRIDVGPMRCLSERAGLTCWVAGTSRGFHVSRAAYRLTASPPAHAVAATPSPTPAGTVVTAPRGFHGGFRSHDDNVVCDLDDTRVYCLVLGARWTPPPATEPCTEGDPSTEVLLRSGRGRALTGCRSDSLAGGDVLRPGHGVRIGDMYCTATKAHVECRNDATKHGFVVSERSFRGY